MTDFYSPTPELPQPSLRVSASPGIDRASRTVVLGWRTDSSPQVLREAIAAAHREKAAVRAVLFSRDMTAGPSGASIEQVKELSRPLIAEGLEFEIQRADTDVAGQILDLAEQHRARLVVLSMRRRSPMMKLFLGSAAQRVIMEAPCPVLSVR